MKSKKSQIIAFVMAITLVFQMVFISGNGFMAFADETQANNQLATIAAWMYAEDNIPSSSEEGASVYDSTSGTGILTTTGTVGTQSKNGISVSGWDKESTYWEIQLSTKGYTGLTISAKTKGSGTGPAHMGVKVSTDGEEFTETDTFDVSSSFKNVSFNLTEAASDADTLYVRLYAKDADNINGGTVSATGTNWLNNIVVKGNTDGTEVTTEATTEQTTTETESATENVTEETTEQEAENLYDPITEDIVNTDVLTIDKFYTSDAETMTVIGQVVYRYGNNGSVNTTILEDVIDGEVIGLQVYSALSGYNVGDIVEVTGTASTYGDVKQLQAVSKVNLVKSAKAIEAQRVTINELKENADKYMSEYVVIKNATLGAYSKSNTPITDETGSMNIYKAAEYSDGLAEGSEADVYAAFSKYKTTLQLRNGSSSDYVSIAKDGEYTIDDSVVLPVATWAGTGPYETGITEIYADLDSANDQKNTQSKVSLSTKGQPFIANTSGTTGSTSYYMGAKGLQQGDYYLIETSTAMYGNVEMSFSMKTSATGSKTYNILCSTDGTEYVKCDTITISAKGTWENFTVTLPKSASNADKLYVKVAVPEDGVNFNGTTPGTGANNYFTALTFTGSPIVSDTICGIAKVTPDAGEVTLNSELTMTSVTDNASIYYSINGSEYALYDDANKPVLTELPSIVTTYTSKSGLKDSLKVTYGYTQLQVAPVKASPNGGSVKAGTKLTLTDATEDAVILYSTDNGTTWNEYIDKIVLDTLPITVLVKGTKEGYKESETTTLSFTERLNENYNIYFGQIHAHTSYSDGAGTCEEAFQYATNVDNLDFLAVTDHSNSLDNANSASISDGSMSTEWVEGHELADKYTTDDFVGLYGYEMTWSNGLGHINTFNTAGFQSRTQTEYSTYSTALQNYYATLKKDTGSISQFNHPGTTFGDFSDFSYYDDEIDELINLIEVGNGEGAIGSSGYFPSYEYYTRALDKGWHVAPTNNQDNHKGKWGDANTGRTVVLCDTLTRDNIYDALRNLRVYATEDNNLSITYKLNGEIMGTTMSYTPDKVEITADIADADNEALGTVEVIVNGGLSIASEKVTSNTANLKFELPADYSYYYLKVTEADGDIAVTAPVWISDVEAVGITSISTDAPLPVAGQDLNVKTELYNNEKDDFEISSIEYSVNDETVYTVDTVKEGITTIPSCGTVSTSFAFNHAKPGAVNLYVTVKGTLNGVEKVYKDVLQLTFVDESMVTKVIIDGTHYNDYVTGYYGGNVGNFTKLASSQNIEVKVEKNEITKEMLKDCSLLVISAPAKKEGTANAGSYYTSHFEDSFIQMVKEYTDNGGTLVVCGIADYQDTAYGQTSTEINKLLEGIGATTRLYSDEAYDTVNNGGQPYRMYYTEFNTANKFVNGAVDGQKYSAYSGCTVKMDETALNNGTADWLVKGHSTTYSIDSKKDDGSYGDSSVVVPEGEVVALGVETLASGANVFVGGSVFISDFEVEAELDNIWDVPYLNRTIALNILDDVKVEVPVTDIADVRKAELGEVFAIEGYVTAGTAVEGNTFFDTIYVQDKTGGITVFPYSVSGLKLGAKVKITGYVDAYQGDKELQVITSEIIDNENLNVIEPTEMSNANAMDYDANGGRLVKVTGKVKKVESSNGVVSQLILTDDNGDDAKVFIDGYIYSQTTGTNTVAEFAKEGNIVSAVGLVYLHPEGDSEESVCVLRVRNTDEITLVKGAEEETTVEETETETTTEITTEETTEAPTENPSHGQEVLNQIVAAIVTVVKKVIEIIGKLFGRR